MYAPRCVTLGNQSNSYYRVGRLDACEGMMGNIGVCMKAKAQSDEVKARHILEHQMTRPQRPPGPPIWQLKETPGWK